VYNRNLLLFRPIGSDIAIGEHLLSDRCVLGAAELGLLAMIGRRDVRVYRRPSISVLSTGNELSDDDHLRHGQIRDANRPSLLALFTSQGFEVKDAGIARDSEPELVKALREVFMSSDVVVTSGGVSMGEKDLLKSVLVSSFGFTIHFGRVFMKPGLPSTFASGDFDGKRRFIFALPGNPVSTFVCAHLFVIPALRRMSGHWNHSPTILRVKLQETLRLDHRPEYRRAWLDTSKQQQRGDDHIPGAVCTSKNQMSSRLSSACGANLLLRLPAAAPPALTSINEGTVVDALVIAPL